MRMLYVLLFGWSGNFYEPLPTQYEAGNNLEEENEKMTDQLKDKIHVLKSVSGLQMHLCINLYFCFCMWLLFFFLQLSIDIGAEVKYQDKLLRDMVSY